MSRSFIAIILIVVATVAYVLWQQEQIKTDGTPTSLAFREISSFRTAISMFEIDEDRFPTTEEGLKALLSRPAAIAKAAWHGPYLEPKAAHPLIDPWGRLYVYECPGKHNRDGFDVYSLGPNGKGGDEAIGNWTSAGKAKSRN